MNINKYINLKSTSKYNKLKKSVKYTCKTKKKCINKYLKQCKDKERFLIFAHNFFIRLFNIYRIYANKYIKNNKEYNFDCKNIIKTLINSLSNEKISNKFIKKSILLINSKKKEIDNIKKSLNKDYENINKDYENINKDYENIRKEII